MSLYQLMIQVASYGYSPVDNRIYQDVELAERAQEEYKEKGILTTMDELDLVKDWNQVVITVPKRSKLC